MGFQFLWVILEIRQYGINNNSAWDGIKWQRWFEAYKNCVLENWVFYGRII